MEAYRVAEVEAQADFTNLVDRAAAGEQVVIIRDGRPIAELRGVNREEATPSAEPRHRTPEAQEAWRRLAELRDSIGPVGISSVELINQMREERELAIWGSTLTQAP